MLYTSYIFSKYVRLAMQMLIISPTNNHKITPKFKFNKYYFLTFIDKVEWGLSALC